MVETPVCSNCFVMSWVDFRLALHGRDEDHDGNCSDSSYMSAASGDSWKGDHALQQTRKAALLKQPRQALVQMCLDLGLSTDGAKEALVERILAAVS